MASGKNTNGENMRSFCGSHSSNDLAPSAPVFSWAPSQAMCTTYSINSSQAMQQQVRGFHDSLQIKGMPHDMPAEGICEENTPTLKEAPTCTDELSWEHPHSLHQHKIRIVTDGNILLEKNDLDHHADDNLQQLEEYVNELVPALRTVRKSTHSMDIAHRQEAIRLTADALLVRRATPGMAWSDTLSKRVSNYCIKAHGHQCIESLDLAEISMEDPDYMICMECASSSCTRTPVSSEGTNSCEFADHDFSAFHHGSTASLASSDHSSMVGSTTELLQDDMDVLNNVQSGVSLPLMEIIGSSDAHMRSVNSSGELNLSMCKQGEKQLKSVDQLHEEINARLAMIRSCCKEWNEDVGIAKKSSTSALESLQVASSTREQHVCTINDTSANVKNYHLMRKHGLHMNHHGVSLAAQGGESFHAMHQDVPCGRADVAHSELTHYDSAAVAQLPCAEVHNGHEVACLDADVACNVDDVAFQRADVAPCNSAEVAQGKPTQCEMGLGNSDVEGRDMTMLQGIHTRGKAAIDDVANEVDAYCSDVDSEVEGKMEADQVAGGGSLRRGQAMTCLVYRPAEDDVADEVANEAGHVGAEVEGRLRWQQGLTWQSSTYVPTRDDVIYGAELDAYVEGAIRKGSHRGNNKMREMMYRVAAYQPIDWETIMEEVVGKERPRRRNVRISKEPQSVAARRRRERISDRIRILQRLVPGTSKLDTASMLDEAIHYLKFLKLQVIALRRVDKIFNSLPLPLATSDCPLHLAPPYPFHHSPSTPTPSHFHPIPLQI